MTIHPTTTKLSIKLALLILFGWLFGAIPAFSQGLVGRWNAFEGEGGEIITVTLNAGGSGQAVLKVSYRELAPFYGEGSRFWRTFHATGGYYFIVTGEKTCNLSWTSTRDSLKITLSGTPKDKVSAVLDEKYSSRDLSEQGDYKKQVIAQWKRDLPDNEDVKKNKAAMQEHLQDFLGPVFDVMVAGSYSITSCSDSLRLFSPSLEADLLWRRE